LEPDLEYVQPILGWNITFKRGMPFIVKSTNVYHLKFQLEKDLSQTRYSFRYMFLQFQTRCRFGRARNFQKNEICC
jgi:hypothetical protein